MINKGICFSLSSLGVIISHIVIKQGPFQHSLKICLFVSGGAGAGKSQLIFISNCNEGRDNPNDVRVLLTAPTGTAAHNIGGVTLHSAILLPLGQTKSFVTLSDDKSNMLRSKTSNLQLLIIDEISMVGNNPFLQLHCRLS